MLEVDGLVVDLAGTTGVGSVAARRVLLGTLFGRATAAEADFLNRLLLGELRQGALQGVMTDAIARAAAAPLAEVRRAAMLSGDLCETARLALTGGAAALGDVHLQVMQPVQPMLAASVESVGDALVGHRTRIGRMEARRRAHPGAPRRRRGRVSSPATSTR